MTAKYEKEKSRLTGAKDIKQDLDDAKALAEKYEREGDFNKAAELKYGKIPKLEEELRLIEENIDLNIASDTALTGSS